MFRLNQLLAASAIFCVSFFLAQSAQAGSSGPPKSHYSATYASDASSKRCGVYAYRHSSYRGSRWKPFCGSSGKHWHNKISSFKIPYNYVIKAEDHTPATLHSAKAPRQRTRYYAGNVPNVGSYMNDRASKMQLMYWPDVYKKCVRAHRDHRYTGEQYLLCQDNIISGSYVSDWNDRISSFIVPQGKKIRFCQDSDMTGKCVVYKTSQYELNSTYNDSFSSFEVVDLVPDPVKNLAAKKVSAGVQVSWQAPGYIGFAVGYYDKPYRYHIYRVEKSSGKELYKGYLTRPRYISNLIWTDYTASPDKNYYYKVLACNKYGGCSENYTPHIIEDVSHTTYGAEEGFTSRVWTGRFAGQYRIPALIQTKNNVLIAVTEKRGLNHDYSGNDLYMKRSTDGGRTWGKEVELHQDGDNVLGMPTILVTDNNLVAFLFLRFPEGVHMEKDIEPGKYQAKLYAMYSADDGATWTKPVEFTRQVTTSKHRCLCLSIGAGLIIQHGEHKGRAVVPSHARIGKKGSRDKKHHLAQTIYHDSINNFKPVNNSISYEQAKQITKGWTAGAYNSKSFSTEMSLVEYGFEGNLYYLARIWPHDKKGRLAYDTSSNGGSNWHGRDKKSYVFPHRTDSGLVRFINPADWYSVNGGWSFNKSSTLVFTTPVGPFSIASGRTDGRAFATKKLGGESATWRGATYRVISDNFFAYSSSGEITDPIYTDQRIGVLYEGGTGSGYEFINFSNISLDYVRSGPVHNW